MKKKQNVTRIKLKDFKDKFENAKSKNQIVNDDFIYIRPVDLKKAVDFVFDHFDKLSKKTKLVFFTNTLAKDEIFRNAYDKKRREIFDALVDAELTLSEWIWLKNLFIKNQVKNLDEYKKEINDHIKRLEDEESDDSKKEENTRDALSSLIDKGELDKAIEKFYEIKDKDKKQTKIAYELAKYLSYKMHNYDEALMMIEYSLETKPKNQDYINLKNEISKFVNKGNNEEINNTLEENINALEHKEETQEKEETVEIIDENNQDLSRDELISKYELEVFQDHPRIIDAVIKNKNEDEGYLSFFEANEEDQELLYLFAKSKYELDDETRVGKVKALNRLTSTLLESNDLERAREINQIALEDRPNNTDAQGFKRVIDNWKNEEIKYNDRTEKELTKSKDTNTPLDKYYEFENQRRINIYKGLVDQFINIRQFNYRYENYNLDAESPEEEKWANLIKDDISSNLFWLDIEIKGLLRNHVLKMEAQLITIAKMYGYIDEQSTSDLYQFFKTNREVDRKEVANILFRKLDILKKHDPYREVFKEENFFDLFSLLLHMLRNLRNFLVHSEDGIFIENYSVYHSENLHHSQSMLNKTLEKLNGAAFFSELSTDYARSENRIFQYIILLIVLNNDEKISSSILTEIDYKLYTFFSSLLVGGKSNFYNSIGLKLNWFQNIINFITSKE